MERGHNHRPPHPKFVEDIISYLGYVPNGMLRSEALGTMTKLYRMHHGLSLEEFFEVTGLGEHLVHKIETYRHCKVTAMERRAILSAIKKGKL